MKYHICFREVLCILVRKSIVVFVVNFERDDEFTKLSLFFDGGYKVASERGDSGMVCPVRCHHMNGDFRSLFLLGDDGKISADFEREISFKREWSIFFKKTVECLDRDSLGSFGL